MASLLARFKNFAGLGGQFRSARRSFLIPVRPKNYRRIALRAIAEAKDPVVLIDRRRSPDFTKRGPLTQSKIRVLRQFEIRDGKVPILGFHDHPDQMWVSSEYASLAKECQEEGWLKIERTVA